MRLVTRLASVLLAILFPSLPFLPFVTSIHIRPLNPDNSTTTTMTKHHQNATTARMATISAVLTHTQDDIRTNHGAMVAPTLSLVSSEQPDSPSPWEWMFRLYPGTDCSGEHTWVVMGSGVYPCSALSPPQAWLGIRSMGVANLNLIVELFHDMECETVPVFTISNGTDERGCWYPGSDQAALAYRARNR